jgi:hypothetical protein
VSNAEKKTSGGVELTDEVLDRAAAEAEEGYDVEQIRPRMRSAGGASPVERGEDPGRCPG